ncbi:MAG: winged helix-turn-helix domain-containing protein [Sphingomicrobium sp.]
MDLTPIVLAHEQAFTIADVEIRPATREVVNAGSVTILEPRVMQLLVALHRADGAVVSKDDLGHLVWEGRIVGEDAINRVVSRLRAVAEKQAGGVFRLETITKVGYRLCYRGSGASAGEPLRQSGAAPRYRLSRRDLMIGGGAVTAAAVGVGIFSLQRDPTPLEARTLIKAARDSVLGGSVEQLSNNISKLREAVQLAPRNAEAWGLLAYYTMVYWNFSPLQERSDLRARGSAAIRRALALEPNQADALAAELYATPEFRNWYNLEVAARAALAHHPNHPGLNFALADVLVQVGRARDALPFLDKARSALPLAPPIHTYRVICLWDLGLLDEAEAALNAAFDLMPRYYGIWFTRLYFLMYNGRTGEALAMFQNVAGRPLGIPDWNYDLTGQQVHALATGDRSDIAKTIANWKDAPRLGTGFMENAAIFAAFVGDLDEAFRQLDALYFNRGVSQYYFAKEQGVYASKERHTYNLFRRPVAPLRHDPRFAVLTRELGLEDYWRRTNTKAQVTG